VPESEDDDENDPVLADASKRLAEWEALMLEVISRKAALDRARLACWTAKTPEEYALALDAIMKLLRARTAEITDSN
jgi:hypothetical protein